MSTRVITSYDAKEISVDSREALTAEQQADLERAQAELPDGVVPCRMYANITRSELDAIMADHKNGQRSFGTSGQAYAVVLSHQPARPPLSRQSELLSTHSFPVTNSAFFSKRRRTS